MSLLMLSGAGPAPSQGSADSQNWETRSTGPNVLWAHDFSESDNELEYFVRLGGDTNPDPTTLINPLTLVSTPFGSSRAIKSQAVGTVVTADLSAQTKGTTGVTVSVEDASRFPDPADFGGSYDGVFFGCTDTATQDTSPDVFEEVTVTGRDTGANTLTITRTSESNSIRVDGVNYSAGSPNAPAIDATSGNYTIGYTNSGSWNRPMCCFATGDNGLSTDDIGITNGSAAKTRIWDPTRDGNGHAYFREGYWGSKWYWDPAVNASALYTDWTPNYSGDGQDFSHADAFEGDEFYLQFRFKTSEARLAATRAKLYYIQNTAVSGPSQLFGDVGPQRYNEQPAPADDQDTVAGAIFMTHAGGGDGRQPAGATFGDDIQQLGMDFGSDPWHTDYPGNYDNRNDADCYVFCHQSDTWITVQIHMKMGRCNAEADHPAGTGSGAYSSPFAGDSDSSYHTLLEVKAALPGDTEYKTLVNKTDALWFFGDLLGDVGNLLYNAPGVNAFWMTQEFNMYVGSGSVAPPDGYASAEFTQPILSRAPIPLPDDIPEYVQALAENEIAALTTVTNGNDTYFDAAGAAWQANPTVTNDASNGYTTHLQNADSYSGGIGNPSDRICYMHGGGHAASSYNGVIGFDFKGTTAPTGFFLVPGSESPVPSGQNYPKSDGWPSATHTYDELGFDYVNRRFVRFGGSSFQTGGGGADGDHWYLPADGGAGNPWVDFGNTFGVLANVRTVVDPVSNKLFYSNDNLACYFLDFSDYTFSSSKTASPASSFHQNAGFMPDAAGSSSGTVVVIGQSQNYQAAVDFDAETVGSWSALFPTGDTDWLSDQMMACFWDEYLEVLWIFGGRVDATASDTLTDFYRYDPATNVSTKVTVTGTMPDMDRGAGSPYGLNKRFVYIPEWRAVGIITVYNKPAYIWKLPST